MVSSSAACRWLICGSPLTAGGSAVPCSSRGRVSARVRARARVRVRARVRARARARARVRVRKSAIARRGWWRWVLCGVWVVYEWCYVVVEWCYVVVEWCFVVGEWCMGGGMVLCR